MVQDYAEQQPDLVLMDYSMSLINGAEATRVILKQYPAAKIVILSGFLSSEELSQLDCGAVIVEHKPLHFERLKEILNQIETSAGSDS